MLKKLLTITLILSLIILFVTFFTSNKVVRAQEGQINLTNAVPIFTGFDLQSTMNYKKNFGFDLIATNIAKRILHTMSLDIVDWINTGFNGNPAFLNNPGGFFLDAVDQVTGQFIFEGGLAGLCSPFEIDIKAALYMGQAGYETRYACTLGQIIDNTRNIGDNVYINGGSMSGFMGGDFTQGGWPAFIAMTTEPQNNPTGAYLKAKSELAARVGERRAAINIDLDRGNGFLSWPECKEVKTVENPDEMPQEMETAQQLALNDSSITTKLNNDGSLTYQRCETATPGSVISGSVNKSLGAGQDELVAADDINSIINALISTMARSVLTGGLKGFSDNKNSNYSSTRYREMIEADYVANNELAAGKTLSDSSTQVEYITQIKSYYDKSVELVSASKAKYLEAKACYTERLNGTRSTSAGASLQIYLIDNKLAKEVDPLLSKLLQKQSSTNTLYQKVTNTKITNEDPNNLNAVQQNAEYSAIQLLSLSGITQSTVDSAVADWQNATNKSTGYMAEAQNMLNKCND